MRVLCLALALAGCAPHVVASTSAGGVVSGADWSSKKALAVADAQCAKDGKTARPASNPSLDGNMNYECVAK